jgi:UDP:flavonoid glycosyltransferase YjiC (YdhE family)
MLKLSELSEISLCTAIREVLSESSYRNNAQKMRKIIQESGGVVQVADILETAAQTRQPVTGRSTNRQ